MSKVRKMRVEKGLSRKSLAKRAKLSESVVRRAEEGYELFSSEWARIAGALRVSPRQIIVIQNGGLFHREKG
jgi:ribosome-binding protein aMBF1 (putative translation factor)